MGSLTVMAEAEEMKIVTLVEPPANFLDENNQPTGITVDFVREIQKRVGNNDPIKIKPWKRAYNMALRQPNVVIFTASRTKAREDLFHWISLSTVRRWTFFAKKGSGYDFDNLNQLKSVSGIGVMRGNIRESFLRDRGFNNIQLTNEHLQNLKKLLVGRIDLMFNSDLGMASICKDEGLDFNAVIEPVFDAKVSRSWIMISKKTSPEIVAKWRKAAEEIKADGTFKRLSQKWVKHIEKEYGAKTEVKNGAFYYWKE